MQLLYKHHYDGITISCNICTIGDLSLHSISLQHDGGNRWQQIAVLHLNRSKRQ